MIKDVEIAMVNAATYALDYQEKKYNAEVEEIIKKFLNEPNFLKLKGELKIYSVAAINEILKLKRSRENKSKNNKQLMQMFVNSIPEFSRKINEGNYD